MTTTQKQFRRQLLSKAAEIRTSLQHRAITVESSADDLERIHLATERDIEVERADSETRLLREVEDALARIKDGSFGVCNHCEEEIPPKRLAAIPWATHCLTCQERMDRRAPGRETFRWAAIAV